MSAKLQPNAELEIAHVLFIDVVGYSRLLINEQSALLAELNQLVRTTDHFRTAEAAGKLIRIPVGDGMALVFFTSPEAPVQCALEICKALQEHPHVHLRMGFTAVRWTRCKKTPNAEHRTPNRSAIGSPQSAIERADDRI